MPTFQPMVLLSTPARALPPNAPVASFKFKSRAPVVIVGTPGTGKSAFSMYLLFRLLQKHPNYIFPSLNPSVTNKNAGAGWRKSCGVICASIFAVTEPPLQSLKGGQCWRNFQITWSGKINLSGLEHTTPCNFESK